MHARQRHHVSASWHCLTCVGVSQPCCQQRCAEQGHLLVLCLPTALLYVVDAAADTARHAGPGSPWSKLYKYVVRAVDSNSKGSKKKGQAAQQRPPSAAADAPSTSAAAAQQQQPTAGAASSSSSSSKTSKCCWGCSAAGAGVSLRKCSSCSKAMYCSRSCQEGHWKEHKADCKKWTQAKAAAGQ
jgi:hypothetical protein